MKKLYRVESDLWWLGFDCGHSGDAQDPELLEHFGTTVYAWNYDGVVRTKEYVENECKSLAEQLVLIV